jgi:hypothetical protein
LGGGLIGLRHAEIPIVMPVNIVASNTVGECSGFGRRFAKPAGH